MILRSVKVVFVCAVAFDITSGLIVHCPGQGVVFPHVPSGFDDQLTQISVVNKKLVPAFPKDACSAIKNHKELLGQIALIERGSCNFTDKIQRAQQSGAVAVVVADSRTGDSDSGGTWAVIMSGSKEEAGLITIPSVFVSKETGCALWKAFSNRRGRLTDSEKWCLSDFKSATSLDNASTITINATGSVLSQDLDGESPLTLLACYLAGVIMMMVLSCGLGLGLTLLIAVYQRDHRKRALAVLEKRPFTKADVSQTEGATEESNSSMCAVCLDEYEEGDEVTCLPCKHVFHSSCVIPWLAKGPHHCCPFCKVDPVATSQQGRRMTLCGRLLSSGILPRDLAEQLLRFSTQHAGLLGSIVTCALLSCGCYGLIGAALALLPLLPLLVMGPWDT